MSGTLKVDIINSTDESGLLSYHPNGWTGVNSTQWAVGTINSQGVIRSNSSNLLHYRVYENTSYIIWDAANDGSGSGLDADLLDGKHASEFALSSHTHSYLPLSGGTLTGALKLNSYLFFKNPSYETGVYFESSGNLNICAHSNYTWKKIIATINYDGTAKFNYYVDFLGGAGNSGSDIRFKKKLSDSIESVINDVLSLKIFPYIWEKEGETHWNTFGVNADDVIRLKTQFSIKWFMNEMMKIKQNLWIMIDLV